jgi:hypothetical protein
MTAYLAHLNVCIIPALVCVVEYAQVEAGYLGVVLDKRLGGGVTNDIVYFLGLL